MSASLVGSEMCIRDRFNGMQLKPATDTHAKVKFSDSSTSPNCNWHLYICLLYTSDAADDM
eukprot:9773378-Alexandrium_andersonii.AAC.1